MVNRWPDHRGGQQPIPPDRGASPTCPGPWRPIPARVLPRGYELLPASLLTSLEALPCPVFVLSGRRAVLYAQAGAAAREIARRVERGATLLMRTGDREVLNAALAAALPGVLADGRLPPAERSRRAYAMTSHVVGPLFAARNRVVRQELLTAHEAVDAVVLGLVHEEDLLWSMVATMQRHLRTHTHAINTAIYAVVLARVVTLSDRLDVRDVGRGALLHDIGKNRVPERILDKPGPLDPQEWRIMRTHPAAGYEIVVDTLGSVPTYAHIILEHHERADGSGYPAGRREGDTPLDSQLVAIVDAFDALTSARPYHAASPPFDALHTMRFGMAGQFNERLLREFILLIGDRDRFRRADYRELGVDRFVAARRSGVGGTGAAVGCGGQA